MLSLLWLSWYPHCKAKSSSLFSRFPQGEGASLWRQQLEMCWVPLKARKALSLRQGPWRALPGLLVFI